MDLFSFFSQPIFMDYLGFHIMYPVTLTSLSFQVHTPTLVIPPCLQKKKNEMKWNNKSRTKEKKNKSNLCHLYTYWCMFTLSVFQRVNNGAHAKCVS